MIKKHLTPSLILVLLLMVVAVFAYQMPLTQKNLVKQQDVQAEEQEKVTVSKSNNTVKNIPAETKTSESVELNFAEETLPIEDKRIAKKMKVTLASHTYGNLQTHRLHRKAEQWFPVIEPILAKHGIPEDFKYLVLVESGLKEGVSHKGAAGIWQFMPATARHYGLKVNSKIDERYDLEKSTIAAAKYIKDMYRSLNSWTLAAAAYNVGSPRLTKQMKTQRQKNYYKLKLNKETGSYVYKVISMKQILEHPVRYGYQKPKNNDDYVIE